MIKIGILQFPGSNCDADCARALKKMPNCEPIFIWHKEISLPSIDGLILPGGFSYGDYLRGGAIAALSDMMGAVHGFAKKGGKILGICNGFQILTEAQLLPGVLLRNERKKFRCHQVEIAHSGFFGPKKILRMPIAHGEGRYYNDRAGIARLQDGEQIAFQYVSSPFSEENPNGSCERIAGIFSEDRRILGMMPHPERAMDELLGSADGVRVFENFFGS